ncbi:MAG: hypothetical protein AVDCRST_MAG93-7168 [uncultured Chloroflexia bacterium]|uniref:NERD domain-containing protein n=1 Tax=uncultured Chloroflexia bacterium TaxID=1672391 RepID=A0A6J4M895_9CHLR|nr:MAG: hypothetical protein AVDCRST_MAG93-7168 [uncultured Chloroflexia bacterium]
MRNQSAARVVTGKYNGRMGPLKRSKAGRSAWREHRRRMIPGVVFAIVLMIVCFLYGGLVANGYVEGFAAILFGLCLVALYVFWDKSTDRIDQRWGEGARGESKVGAELERLHKQGFYVFHDWDSGRGNVDHFAIGPQGVFAVEAKALRGEVTCEGGRLLVGGRPVPGKDVAKQAMGEAMDVKRLVRESSGLDPFVHAILCFSRAEVSCYAPVGNVEVTNLGSLNRALVERPERYSPKEVKAISRLLEKRLGVSPAAGPGSPPDEPSKVAKFLIRERNVVLAMLCLLVVVSILFAGTTANLLQQLVDMYRSAEAIGN